MARIKPTLSCCSCKQQYPREEIIYYGSQENPLKYCPTCYKEKRAREKFYDFICELFGIRAPGPKIYAQRKNLKEKYGYSDDTIMQTLEYLYKVEHYNKGFESLGLVNPQNVDKALSYFESIKKEREQLAAIEPVKVKKIIVPIKPKEKKVELLDINDYLDDQVI